MAWSKIKQNLEGFLCPDLKDRVQYSAAGYRYLPDKTGRSYILVDGKEVLNMAAASSPVRWYGSEQEIKNDAALRIPLTQEDLDTVRQETGGKAPEERLAVIARNRKITILAKELMTAQADLVKSDFYAAANLFLSTSLEKSLESGNILLNIFALLDRRLGKKRLLGLEEKLRLKHPAVQYFYDLRRSAI